MNGITKWLKDKKNNILIPNTLTKTVYDDEGKNLDEILTYLANQNAFSNVKIGSTTIAADSTTDTLTIAAGDNIIITPDAETDEITISSVGSASFEELSYTDYQAGNYDPTKSYTIPDYPDVSGNATIKVLILSKTSSSSGTIDFELSIDDGYILSSWTEEGYAIRTHVNQDTKTWCGILYNGTSVATDISVTVKVIYVEAKALSIPVYTDASEIAFDDSVAKLGADNVQGAIEANTARIEATKKVETGTLGKPITTGTYGNEMLMKKDGIVYLSCRLLSTSVTGYTTVWATLPEGFRPKEPTHLMGSATIGGTRMPILIYINAFGAIQQSYGSIEATELIVSGSFIAAE